MFSFNQFSQFRSILDLTFWGLWWLWWRFRPQDKTTLWAVDFRCVSCGISWWMSPWQGRPNASILSLVLGRACHPCKKGSSRWDEECYDNDRWVQLRVPEFGIYTSLSFWYVRMMKNVHHVSRFPCLKAFQCCCRCSIGVTQLLSTERESSPISCDF